MRKPSIFHIDQEPSFSGNLREPTRRAGEACIPRMRQAIACFAVVAWGLILEGNLSATTALPGFSESVISGPWSNTAGIAIENNGRPYAWEAKIPPDFTMADAVVAAANVQLSASSNPTLLPDGKIVFGRGRTDQTAAPAAIIIVTSSGDGGAGSLRQALTNAQDGDTITFSVPTITLTSGELTITKNIAISGPGADVLSVQRDVAAPAFRIFRVNPGHTVTIEGMTISNGLAPAGGGIYNDHSTLTVQGCVLSSNSASAGNTSPLQGGGAI